MKKLLMPLMILALATLAPTGVPAQSGAARGGVRDRVPVLPAKDFNLESLKGRVVLMAFWKTPDEASARMIPWLNGLQEDLGPEGLTVVAVNVDRKSAAAGDAVGTMHHRIQIVLDPTERMVTRQKLSRVPGGVLYDRTGARVWEFNGFGTEDADTMTPIVKALVAEKVEEGEPEEK